MTTSPTIATDMETVLDTVLDSGPDVILSIDDHKMTWITCEESKVAPKTQLKEIGKKQRASTKALRIFMEENELDRLDCGAGWFMTHESVEKVTFSEDVCGSYMDATVLERLKQEQKKRKSSFKTVPPAKKPRVAENRE
jgi:hypothetical protein